MRIRPREESEDFQGRAKDESKDSMFGSFIRGLFLFQSIGKRQKDLVDKKGAKHPFRRPESAHKASLSVKIAQTMAAMLLTTYYQKGR